MAIRLVFLGRLEDAAGAGQRDVEPAGSLEALIARLEPELANALGGERIRVALNGALVTDRHTLLLADGDEIAFLPPVSGG